jgi:2-methylisocitrate lyase-like PEP mutase family enzyme
MAAAAAQRLRALLAEPGLLVVPGAFDALAARLIEAAGFRAVYATGAGIANAYLGWADVGLTTMTEVRDAVWHIVDATSLPVIADIDTGFGNAVNVTRTVRAFERIGVAAVQLEDQVFPKRCGHFAGKAVVSPAEMVGKLRAACDARQQDLVIIARTDARAVEGLEAAIARARAYREAGADVLFVEAPRSREELAAIAAALGDAPLLVNLVEGGQTPLLPAAELAAMGYKLALYPNTALRAAVQGMQRALGHLAAHGSSLGAEHLLIDWETRQRLVRLPEIEALERRYAAPD